MALCACAHMLPRLPWLYFELFKQQVQLKTLNIIIADARLSLPCKLLACMICRNFTQQTFCQLMFVNALMKLFLYCDLFSPIPALSNIEIASFLRWYILVELHSPAYARRYYGIYDMLENSMMKVRFYSVCTILLVISFPVCNFA